MREHIELLNDIKSEYVAGCSDCGDCGDCDVKSICFDFCVFQSLNLAIQALEQEPKYGKWIEHKHAEEYDGVMQSNFECSKCHDWLREKTSYCPNCGAKMEER